MHQPLAVYSCWASQRQSTASINGDVVPTAQIGKNTVGGRLGLSTAAAKRLVGALKRDRRYWRLLSKRSILKYRGVRLGKLYPEILMHFIIVGLLCALNLPAQVPGTVFMENLTWTEVRTLIQTGTTTVVFPTGGIEQNGPHMVLGKHNFRVRYAAEKIAQRLGNTLVAPVLPYAPQGEFNMKYPGTIELPDEYFRKVLEHGARSLKRHGFKDIVIICDSGSDRAALTALVASLNTEWAASEARVHFVPEYRRNGFDDWLLKQGESKEDIGLHAGILDTSLLMAIDPTLIRRDKLTAKGEFAESVNGDPAHASAQYGRKGLELMIDATVTKIRELKVTSRRKN